jgi:FMN-dependent NADH-azoreductase
MPTLLVIESSPRSGSVSTSLTQKFAAEWQLVAADTIVIGAPMHNFAISAPLKAWIDQIVRAGVTFSVGPQGYKGLLDSSKKVIVASARGGEYTGDLAFLDNQTPYLKTILGFLGLTDVHFAVANNQSRGPEAAEAGVKTATEAVLALA